ncbi:hypothetical protein CSC2_32010 [Clostridium zeae]|uniref:Lantibiotic dehydratase n=1 Tax=Clostridium zeae TaxID=2759022 RepID=A0ABQ1ED29_9CLOT|nr:lantibiotic dehydratase [Clostridium zeae]GFZ32675.1 hypothetical protein CSC2_32010 [Clostridium zeae]
MSRKLKIKDNTDIYKTANFFMMRTPILSLDKYYELSNINESFIHMIKDLFRVPLIREAILVSSKSLYDSLKNSENYNQQIVSSFLKYFIRMSTRTTPFGLFASVNIGSFDKETNMELNDYNHYTKRARVDMKWLLSVLKKIEMDKNILFKLRVKCNSTYLFKGNRIDNLFLSYYGQKLETEESKYSAVSIKLSRMVQYTLSLCSDYIRVEDILEKFSKFAVDIPKETILSFIIELLNKEYIISELRPPLTDESPLEYVLNILYEIQEAKKIYNVLLDLKKSIDNYNCLELGQGEEQFLDIVEKMSAFEQASHYLQVDLKSSMKKCILNSEIARDVEKFSKLLTKLSVLKSTPHHLAQYRNTFIEVYGTHREVPFLELIDIDRGIGFPATYMNPISNKSLNEGTPIENELKFQNYIYCKLSEVMIDKAAQIDIRDEEIDALNLTEYDVNKLPISYEINMFVVGSKKAVDDGNYKLVLGPNFGSAKVGKTFGRFMYMFDDSINDKLSYLIRQENEIINDDNVIVGELAYLSENGRSLNVALTKNYLGYELPIATNSNKDNVLDLQDIVVGVENNEFYLKSVKLNKKIVLNVNHMLNPNICNNIYRLLVEISIIDNHFSMMSTLNVVMDKFIYIPRINYKNIIISPRTWKVNCELLKIKSSKENFDNFKTKFLEFSEKYKIDQFVYLTYMDHRLLLNLENELHLRELFLAVTKNKNKYIKLIEQETNYKESIVESKNEVFFSEIVVPLVRTIKNNSKKQNINSNTDLDICSTFDRRRVDIPFGEWIYLKLYGNKNRENELIAIHLNKFLSNLLNQGLVRKVFFIRYSDPEQHIRIRMLKSDESNIELYEQINKFLNSLYDLALIRKATMDTYEKEVERYGGLKLISYAENLFYKDTLSVIATLNLIEARKINMDIKIIGAIGIIKFLEDYGMEFNSQLELFNKVVNPNEYRESFAKYRKDLIKLANSNDNWNSLKSINDGKLLFEIMTIRTDSIMDYRININESKKQGILTNTEENIILSVIHMFCNRLYGTNRMLEKEVMALVRHTLYSLKYFKK